MILFRGDKTDEKVVTPRCSRLLWKEKILSRFLQDFLSRFLCFSTQAREEVFFNPPSRVHDVEHWTLPGRVQCSTSWTREGSLPFFTDTCCCH